MSFLDNVLSGIATKLKTLSGVVDVSLSPAPVAGQVLTAIDATHAQWADPTGGGGGGGGGYIIADALNTGSGDPAFAVDVSGSPIPSPGQVLLAVGTDAATWSDPPWLSLDEFTVANTVIAAIDGDGGLGPVAVYMPPSTVLMRAEFGDLFAGEPTDLATLLSGQALNDSASVPKALFDANTVLTADVDNTPHAITMPPSTVLTRLASGNIKAATVAEMQALLSIGGTAGSVATDINPAHWYRGDTTLKTSTSVDQITDNGSIPKHFTAAGTLRCVTGTDGNGRIYLAPDGIDDVYTAGVAADWKFLNDGTPWTISIVYQRAIPITANETILDTTDGTSNSTGMFLILGYTNPGKQGPECAITYSSATNFIAVTNSFIPSTGVEVLVIRYRGGITGTVTAGVTNQSMDMALRRKGEAVSQCAGQPGNANTNPLSALTLFKRSVTTGAPGQYTATRVYDLIIDNKSWSDRQVSVYENYAKAQYNLPL